MNKLELQFTHKYEKYINEPVAYSNFLKQIVLIGYSLANGSAGVTARSILELSAYPGLSDRHANQLYRIGLMRLKDIIPADAALQQVMHIAIEAEADLCKVHALAVGVWLN
jgi:hypothetical protein